MSDVSEHDSDSDTESSKPPPVNNQASVSHPIITQHVSNDDAYAPVIANDTSVYPAPTTHTEDIATTHTSTEDTATTSTNIVDELKNAVSNAEVASNERPEWEKYLEQSKNTGAYTYTDPTDGTVYEWDAEKRGWIPKIDSDFIALYQANYGFTASGEHNPNIHLEDNEEEEEKKKEEQVDQKEGESKSSDSTGKKRKQEEEKKEWFDIDDKLNNNVYISGLPLTITNDEFVELMMKYGIIMEDDEGTLKIKLYKDSNGELKGDGRCCYLKHESVVLACSMLDDSDYNGSKISVEKAVFELKGKYNPAIKPKKKKKKKKKVTQDKLLDWVDRPKKRSKFDRIVILKHMFDNVEFEKDPSLINELKEDLRLECARFGDIKKLLVFDRNPEGVASILFKEAEFADSCIEALNGRYYAGKTVSAETYDGVTSYDVKETEAEMNARLGEWEKFLEAD